MNAEARLDYATICGNNECIEQLIEEGMRDHLDEIDRLHKVNIRLWDKYAIRSFQELEYIDFLCANRSFDKVVENFENMMKKYLNYGLDEVDVSLHVDLFAKRTYKSISSRRRAENACKLLSEYLIANDCTEYLPFAYYVLAFFLLRQHKEMAAKEVIERSLALPDNIGKMKTLTKVQMVEVLEKLGNIKDAIELAEETIEELDNVYGNEGIVYRYLRTLIFMNKGYWFELSDVLNRRCSHEKE